MTEWPEACEGTYYLRKFGSPPLNNKGDKGLPGKCWAASLGLKQGSEGIWQFCIITSLQIVIIL